MINTELTLKDMCVLALMGALMFVTQLALASLPNIHVVALLIILTAMFYRWRAIYSIAIFVLLEGLIFGFGTWWINYTYVWLPLVPVTVIFRDNDSSLFWAIIAAAHGLLFGAMCAIVYLFIGGWEMAASYWVSGIPFDLIHCASNFVVCFVLIKPLKNVMAKILRT